MIKVNCTAGIERVEEEYPCLKKAVNLGRIVLFTAPKTGFELDGGGLQTNFHHSESWAEESFQLYPGTVELSNAL